MKLALIIIIIILLIYYNYHNIKANIVVFLTISRGILAPNCFWWSINDKYTDSSGIQLYQELKGKNDKISPVNILGSTYYFVTDNNFIKQVLDNSPFIFGVGKLKFSFFESFMKENVGVSEGCPWAKRRKFNMKVLETNKIHTFHLLIIKQ